MTSNQVICSLPGDPLAQAQVTQAGPQTLVLLLPEDLSFTPPLRVHAQRLSEVGLDTTQLKQR